MTLLIIALYLTVYAVLVYRMGADEAVEWSHMGILSIFSVGYYVLPVLFKRQNVTAVSEDEIISALVLHGVFQASIVLGVLVDAHGYPSRPGLSLSRIDSWLERWYRPIGIVAFGAYIVVRSSFAQTSYEADDVHTYFMNRDPLVATLTGLTGMLFAAVCLGFALELRRGSKVFAIVFGGAILSAVGLSLSLAQRLATVTPLAMALTALIITKQRAQAFRWMGLLVIVLVFVSPFAVYMREAGLTERGIDRIVAAVERFSFGESAIETSAGSIMDRADLLSNTIKLKDYFDDAGYAGWIYYYSVLVSPMPRLLIGEKPYLLSYDGTIWGHISVIAWRFDWDGPNKIGSVTAFGGITAYSQGGWLAVVLDGVAVGVLFVFLARWLGGGGAVAKIIYINLLPTLCMKRVPPSFLEALTEFLPLLTVIALVALAGALWNGVHPAPRRAFEDVMPIGGTVRRVGATCRRS